MSGGDSSQELFTSESEIADQELSTSSQQEEQKTSSQQKKQGISSQQKKQKTSSQQEKQESSASIQGETIPDQEDKNGHELQVKSPTPLETPDEEQNDIALVERACI